MVNKSLGQYFTTSPVLQEYVFRKVKYKGALLLEPSFGAGHLLKKFKESDPNYPMRCYELDESVKPVVEFNEHQVVIYANFVEQQVKRKFQTIIGNPPYVKQRGGANLYLKFIEICFDLLEPNGELIFIVPSDFIKLTSASDLITRMVGQGSFTDFLFPRDERLFEGASVDVLVFRYEKGLRQPSAIVNDIAMMCNVVNGIITFSEGAIVGRPFSELFDVYVGLVSALDKVYKVCLGNIQVMNDEKKVDSYIYTDRFPTQNPVINKYLLEKKAELLGRKIRPFTETNWFEWGAPRNKAVMESKSGQPCIYIRNMTRNKVVAFLGTVRYFGGALLCAIPKAEMAQEELQKIVGLLNSEEFQKDYMYAGRFKIGQKQLCNARI